MNDEIEIEIESLNNVEYLESILNELKENEELELVIAISYELDKNKYLYLASKELDDTIEGMSILEQKTVSFDDKDYYFYIVEKIS